MKPSPKEYILLKVLWANGERAARELHEAAADELAWSFSSTRKTLDRMVEKGALETVERHGVKVYRPTVSKVATIAGMMKDFAASVLEIDGGLPVTAFTGSKLLSEDELRELQDMLDGEGEQ